MRTAQLLLDAVAEGLLQEWKDVGLDYLEKKLRTYDVLIRDYPYATFHSEWVYVAGIVKQEIARRRAEKGSEMSSEEGK
jgi:hypothetical protein